MRQGGELKTVQIVRRGFYGYPARLADTASFLFGATIKQRS